MKREITALLKTRSNQIGFVVMLVLIIGAGIVGNIFNTPDDESASAPQSGYVIGIEESAKSAAPFIQEVAPNATIETLTDGEASHWLTDAYTAAQETDSDSDFLAISGSSTAPVIHFPTSGSMRSHAADAVRQGLTLWVASADGTRFSSDDAHAALETVNNIDTNVLDLTDSSNLIGTNPFGYFSSLASLVLLTMVMMGGLATIAMGVVEEKSSRVVELILSSVKPRTLLLGKILGIGVVILGQFAAYIAAAIISLKIANVSLPMMSLSWTVLWTVIWGVVGFFIFSLLAGSLASTVSRQEDLAPITGTLSMLTFIPVYTAMFLVPALPDATVTKVLSYIPLISSFMMPTRQAFDLTSPLEQVVALAIAVASIPLLAMFAGKIYHNSILHSGKRLSIKQAWKQQ